MTASEILIVALLAALVMIAWNIYRQCTSTREMLERKLTVIVGTLQAPECRPALKDLQDNEVALAVGRLNGEDLSEDSKSKLASIIEMKRQTIEELYGEGFHK